MNQNYVSGTDSSMTATGHRTLMACRAYFQFSEAAAARQFVLNFGDGDITGITTTDFTDSTNSDGAWYTLDGRKLDNKPTKKGLYIQHGRKTVIK